MKKVKEYLKQEKKKIEKALNRYLPSTNSKDILNQAMRYAVFSGGKRLRPILTLTTYKLLGGKKKDILPLACAIELIHNFTLIHDDLPCMDNDDLRRGKPTSHKVYGEAIALLAGDALLNHAFWLIAKTSLSKKTNPLVYIRMMEELSLALGIRGTIGGQAEDIRLKKNVSLSKLEEIYKAKTAKLIAVSVKIAAILRKTKKKKLSLLTVYGENLGLAFQIVDDILDKDKKKQNPTYVSLLGEEKAKKLASAKIKLAKTKLKPFGKKAEVLREIADYILSRAY